MVRPGFHAPEIGRRPVGALRNTIDHPAAAAASEHGGVGALHGVDLLHVVGVAQVLRVVADPVHEEVGGAALSANSGRVTMPFALPHGDAGEVLHGLGHGLDIEVGQNGRAEHAHGLRYLAQGSESAGCRTGGGHEIAGRPGRPGAHRHHPELLGIGAGGAHGVLGHDDSGERKDQWREHDIFDENDSQLTRSDDNP